MAGIPGQSDFVWNGFFCLLFWINQFAYSMFEMFEILGMDGEPGANGLPGSAAQTSGGAVGGGYEGISAPSFCGKW